MRLRDIKLANEYAKLVLDRNSKRNITNREYQELAVKTYPTVSKYTYLRAKRTLSQPEIKQLAENRIMQLLDEQGLTENKSSELIDKAVKIAEKQENAKILLEAAKYLNELRGLEPKKTVITESRQYNNADLSNIEGTISKEIENKRKITVSTTVNNIENEGKTR